MRKIILKNLDFQIFSILKLSKNFYFSFAQCDVNEWVIDKGIDKRTRHWGYFLLNSHLKKIIPLNTQLICIAESFLEDFKNNQKICIDNNN